MPNESAPPARPAASLLLLRGPEGKTSANTSVLMGLRGAFHKFMPNRLVFPGGAVDAEDHDAQLARHPRPDVLARLAADGDTALAHALTHAAARELEEETGLSLGAPPDLAGLDYLCRAITPAFRPIRFDARFLLIDAEQATGTLAGSGELEDLRWYGVAEALALDLAYPTRKVLEQLTLWLELTHEAREARKVTPTMRDRAWNLE
jgi:8-oxo-dGTP pyrophosphatase MutT (NUDIX family)